jgi:hypothetical protein
MSETPNTLNPAAIAEALCIEAEKLGLCHPTENMISDRLNDTIANVLNLPEEAIAIPGNEDSVVADMMRKLAAHARALDACETALERIAHPKIDETTYPGIERTIAMNALAEIRKLKGAQS